MTEFGFKLSQSNRIDLDETDNSVFKKVAIIVPDIKLCFNCGSCSASCTSTHFKRVSFRSAILLLNRGHNKEAISMLKSCMLCGKCILVCPRGIDTRNIIINILKAEEEMK